MHEQALMAAVRLMDSRDANDQVVGINHDDPALYDRRTARPPMAAAAWRPPRGCCWRIVRTTCCALDGLDIAPWCPIDQTTLASTYTLSTLSKQVSGRRCLFEASLVPSAECPWAALPPWPSCFVPTTTTISPRLHLPIHLPHLWALFSHLCARRSAC